MVSYHNTTIPRRHYHLMMRPYNHATVGCPCSNHWDQYSEQSTFTLLYTTTDVLGVCNLYTPGVHTALKLLLSPDFSVVDSVCSNPTATNSTKDIIAIPTVTSQKITQLNIWNVRLWDNCNTNNVQQERVERNGTAEAANKDVRLGFRVFGRGCTWYWLQPILHVLP
jgi:hypothetical protein